MTAVTRELMTSLDDAVDEARRDGASTEEILGAVIRLTALSAIKAGLPRKNLIDVVCHAFDHHAGDVH